MSQVFQPELKQILSSLCKACIWFIYFLLSPVKKVQLQRLGATKRRSPSLKQAHQNNQRNPLERRRRRKRRNLKVRSVRRRRARAAVMTAVLQKTDREWRRGKVKTINIQKSGEMRRAASRTAVMTKRRRKEGLPITKNESRPLTETPTQGWIWRKRGGGTGKQQMRRARVIVLQTETAQIMAREITNAACVCRNFRRPSSAGLFCLCLTSTKPKQPFCTCVQTPLHRLEAARAAWWGILGVLSHSSWGILSGGASLIPSTVLIFCLTEAFLFLRYCIYK